MPSALRANRKFTSLFRRGPGRRGDGYGTLLAIFLAVGLSGCTLTNRGLPGGIPQLGSGNLFFATSVMPDAVVGRTYSRIIRFQGGIGPFQCKLLGNPLAAYNLTVSPAKGPTCLLSTNGAPLAGPLGPTPQFTIQVSDSSARTQTTNTAFMINNVRSEFMGMAVVLPDAAQGRPYGNTAPTAQVAQSNVSGAVGNAPLLTCMVTVTGSTAALNGSFTANPAPMGVGCPVASAGVAVLAPSVDTNLMVSITFKDSPIPDPDSAAAPPVVPAGMVVLPGQALIARQVLSYTRNFNPVDDAVVGRTYGAPAMISLTFAVTGGLTGQSLSSMVTAMPAGAGTNLACNAAGSPITCSSGGLAVAGAGAFTVTITATDAGNAAVPPGMATTDTMGNNSHTITVQMPLTTTVNFNPAPDAVTLRKYGIAPETPLKFTGTGGIGNAPAMSASFTTPPGGLACNAAASVETCSSNSITAAGGTVITFKVTASDVANMATPAGTSASDPLRDNTQNIAVDSELVIMPAVIPNGLLNNNYKGFTFTTQALTGIPGATLNWVAPGVATAPCPAGSGSIDGLALSVGGVLSGVPSAASGAPPPSPFFKPQICVFDNPASVGNMVSAPGFAQAIFTFDVIKNLAFAAGTGAKHSVEVVNTSPGNTFNKTIALTVGAVPNGVGITPDGRFAIVTQNAKNQVSVIDTITLKEIAGSPVAFPAGSNCGLPAGVAVSPDNLNVYIACDDGVLPNLEEVLVLDRAMLTGSATAMVTGTVVTGVGSLPDSIAFRDATRGYVTLSGTNTLAIINNVPVPPVQVGVAFPLGADVQPRELVVVPNATFCAAFCAYVAKQNPGAANPGAVDVVDVSTDVLAIPAGGTLTFANNSQPFGVDSVPGTSARIYITLQNANQFVVLDNTVNPPAQIGGSPFNLPDPSMPVAVVTPVGVAIAPNATVPVQAYISLSATDQVAIIDDKLSPAKNAGSPIGVTATSTPGRIRAVPVPQ